LSNVNNLLATLAFALLVAGWSQRRRRDRHVPLVLSGMALDLAMVVWLEISRGVVEEVAGAAPHAPFPTIRWVHIASSTLAVALYFPTFWFGLRMLRGATDPAVRKRHAVFATLALLLRTIGFVCMWGVEAVR